MTETKTRELVISEKEKKKYDDEKVFIILGKYLKDYILYPSHSPQAGLCTICSSSITTATKSLSTH